MNIHMPELDHKPGRAEAEAGGDLFLSAPWTQALYLVRFGAGAVAGVAAVAGILGAPAIVGREGVVDDGAGLKPGLGSGVGLANVREQLATRFGGDATFSLRGLAGGRGAVAEITLPLADDAGTAPAQAGADA